MRFFAIKQAGFAAVLVFIALMAPNLASAADYGIESFDTRIDASAGGGSFSQAAGHPYAITNHIEWSNHPDPDVDGVVRPNADPMNALVQLPPGFVGNPTAAPTCTAAELIGDPEILKPTDCPVNAQVGVSTLEFNFSPLLPPAGTFPLFNMTPPSGLAARFGMKVAGTLIYFDAGVRDDGSYGLQVGSRKIPEALRLISSDVTFWGVPADPSHDRERCDAAASGFDQAAGCGPLEPANGRGEFPSDVPPTAFLRLPTSCAEPGVGLEWTLDTDSWQNPGVFSHASFLTHEAPFWDEGGAPGPEQGPEDCDLVPFSPTIATTPSQHSAGSPTGLHVQVNVSNEGILNPDGIGQSDLKKAVVTLPEGMTINPSQAEGLNVCAKAQYQQERLAMAPGEGCPADSKIGAVVVHTPLLGDELDGAVYVAQSDDPQTSKRRAENPFDSLLAIYIVIRDPERGIYIKIPGRVDPDPRTGQIVTTFDDLPQLPFESFDFRFREGPRAPLSTPTSCGAFQTKALFYPWARPNEPITTTSSFVVDSGVGGGPCPAAGVPPFHPGFSAGALNNNAGSYSPFVMRLTRSDGEQDMTKFSSILPPGVSAKIAGVSKCPEETIAQVAQKSGIEERQSPSCPANSEIGHIVAGAGVGSVLTYVPGKVYLAGPYHGAPLSALVITPAVAGPFDVGNVITREALTLDPKTAEVHVDGDRSDPIPHILKGIPLSVRDIRVYVDRPSFTINPTSCDPSQVKATLFGSFLDVISPADDVPVGLASRFQAANCAALGFKPRLSLLLKGGARRGAFPALRAEVRPRAGDANLKKAVVTLPRSAFLEQGHIGTICTRVQFAAKACPERSIYGHVKAWTPLLDEPLEGPVYLRSSNHKLPDLVLSLHGVVDIEAVGRIDSIHGAIRSSFEAIPDAPVTKVLLTMQGGKKGLIVNSRNLCGKTPKANAEFSGQNGKPHDFRPAVKSTCRKAKQAKH